MFIWLLKIIMMIETDCLFKIYLLLSWKADPSKAKQLRSKKSRKFLNKMLKNHQIEKMKQPLKREISVRRRNNRKGNNF